MPCPTVPCHKDCKNKYDETGGFPSPQFGPVTFTVNISNGPNAGQLQFYDGNTWLGTGWFNGTTAGAPGASHLGTWESTDLGSPVLLFLDIG